MKKLGLDGPYSPDEIQQYRDLADTERAKAHRTGKMIAYPGLGAALAGLATGLYGAAAKKPAVTTLGKILGIGGLGAAGLGGAHALQGSLSHSDRNLLANLASVGRGSSQDIDRYATRAHRYEPEFGGMMGRELKDVHPQLHSEIRDARTRAMLEDMMSQMEQYQTENRMDRVSSRKTAGIMDWLRHPLQKATKAVAEPVAKATGKGIENLLHESMMGGVRGTQSAAAAVGKKMTGMSPNIAAALGLGGTALGGLTGGTFNAAQEAREGDENDPEYIKNVLKKGLKGGLVSGAAGGILGTGIGAAVPYFGGRLLQIMGRA